MVSPDSPMMDDYGEFAQDKTRPITDTVSVLKALVEEARQYEKEVMEAEEALKKAKDRLRAVVQDALPKAMREGGMKHGDSIKVGEVTVTLREKIENSVPAMRRNEAWDWLEEHGYSDILKRKVTIAFAVNEGELAKEVAEALQAEYNRTVSCERWAEPATLKSLLTRLIEEKKDVPRDLFGVRELTVAEIKVKK